MYSMTGFGRATAAGDGREVTVELKSVNHRYLDLSMRLPRSLGFLEDVLRGVLSERLSRGHVDIYVNYRNNRMDARTVRLDSALLTMFVGAAREANASLGLADDLTLSAALRLPDVLSVDAADEDRDAVSALVRRACNEAADELLQMRASEGARMLNDLSARIGTVLSLTERIEARAPLVVADYQAKLSERIELLLGKTEVDRTRLATEVALFADRAAIDEEIVRLKSHVTEMHKLFAAPEPSGRRMDFLVQEMNREFNTIGSKANDAELTKLVLDGKAEIEKIREQVQNIE